MFLLNALLCLGPSVTDCIAVIDPTQLYPTEEACQAAGLKQEEALNEAFTYWALFCVSIPTLPGEPA